MPAQTTYPSVSRRWLRPPMTELPRTPSRPVAPAVLVTMPTSSALSRHAEMVSRFCAGSAATGGSSNSDERQAVTKTSLLAWPIHQRNSAVVRVKPRRCSRRGSPKRTGASAPTAPRGPMRPSSRHRCSRLGRGDVCLPARPDTAKPGPSGASSPIAPWLTSNCPSWPGAGGSHRCGAPVPALSE
jgi:hypothetical protein